MPAAGNYYFFTVPAAAYCILKCLLLAVLPVQMIPVFDDCVSGADW
jgi:hypothetical protein